MSLSQPSNPPTINPGTAKPASSGALFGSMVARTQVNQLHGVANNNQIGTGIPKQVSNVQVSVANAQTGATCTVTVLFRRDSSDTSFSGVNVWVKGYQGNNQLVQVSSGADSPCKFVLNNTGETVSFTIQAFGNGGNAPLNQSPTNSGILPKSTTGGFGSSTTNYYNVTNPPPASGTPTINQVGGGFWGPGLFDLQAAIGYGTFSSISIGSAGGVLTANQVVVYRFTLPVAVTITKITWENLSSNGGITTTVGIYDLSGNLLVDGGQWVGFPSNTIATHTIGAVTLAAGTYWHAQATTSAGGPSYLGMGFNASGNNANAINCWKNVSIKAATAANALSAGSLPATLGVLTGFVPSNANGDGIACPRYESA